ncbi:hypothetical protein KDK77_00395 [bacterium]|nr:hypothetical protein [bacterium]
MIEAGHDITYLLYFYSATAQTLGVLVGTGLAAIILYASWFARKKAELHSKKALVSAQMEHVNRLYARFPSAIPSFEFGCGLVVSSITITASLFMLSIIDSPRVEHLNNIIYTVILGCTVVSLIFFGYIALHAVRAVCIALSIDDAMPDGSTPQK